MKTPTVTPAAIDPLMPIESIHVNGRHRRDLGDIRALADSIDDVDLLNPITLTRDGRLVAGQRRLEACRLLGWDQVPVRYVDTLDDAAKVLHAERDENVCRKDMLPSELAALGEALYAIEAENAKERQREAGRNSGRGIASSGAGGSYSGRETTEVVGEALGMSRSTYADLRSAYNVANDPDRPEEQRALAREALAEIDNGHGIQPTVTKLRQRLRAKREAAEAKAAASAPPVGSEAAVEPDEDWIPAGSDRSRQAVERRRELVREMAPRGYTSGQMAELLGIGQPGLKRIAKDLDIEIIADKVMGRSRKTIDSNRVIREIVHDLDNLEMSLGLVRFDELDTSEIENWTASLSKSIRVLNRLNKQLKEMAQ